jgi:hypothetical protein
MYAFLYPCIIRMIELRKVQMDSHVAHTDKISKPTQVSWITLW